MEAKAPGVLITPLYQTAAKNLHSPSAHPRLCISIKKKKKKP